ncbi:MAG: hypothetical protein IFK91_00855, partial [Acidobacteria bacterium]|nr:hypothetical protein [Candidatus Sulfomarinibacter sp. MAG AM1]
TVVTNGEETHIDVPFKELASWARGGFQIYFEARRNKFFLAFDAVTGEGDDRNGQNLTQQGPTIGAGFKF